MSLLIIPRRNSIVSNQKGFSLIQVLIAFGLTTILALQLFRMNSFQIKTSRNTEVALDLSLMMNQISLYLANSTSCKNTFDSVSVQHKYSFPAGDGIKNRSNELVYQVGEKYAQNKILIKEISIDPSPQDPINPPTDLFGVINVNLVLEKLPGMKNTLTTKEVVKTVSVQVLVDQATGQVKNCFSFNDESLLSIRAQTCEQDLGGNWNQDLGRCENISLGAEVPGQICGTCQMTKTVVSPTNHRDLHRTALPGRLGNLLGRWFHGWQNTNTSNNNTNTTALGVTCTPMISCKGNAICSNSEDHTWCVPTCPDGYTFQSIYQDYDVTDKTYTESYLSTIDLKACVKTTN